MIAVGQQNARQLIAQEIFVRQQVLRVGHRQLRHNQKPGFVGGLEEFAHRSHRVKAHAVEAEAFDKLQPLPVNLRRGGRNSGEDLDVVIAVPPQIERIPVEEQHVAARGDFPDAKPLLDAVTLLAFASQGDLRGVEKGRVGRPQARVGHDDFKLGGFVFARLEQKIRGAFIGFAALGAGD